MNPLLIRGNGSSNKATNPTNNLNTATPQVRKTFNRFNNSYNHYTTCNYAEYTPFFVQEMNPADYKGFSSKTQVRTETLDSPLYSGVKMNKDYFFVPYDAILPFNWEKIFKNPSQGDDVPSDANCCVFDFTTKLKSFLQKFVSLLNSFAQSLTEQSDIPAQVYFTFPLVDAFLSASGICARMGTPFSHLFLFNFAGKLLTWDRLSETLFPLLFPAGAKFGFRYSQSESDIDYYIVVDNSVSGQVPFITSTSDAIPIVKMSGKDVLALFRYYPACMQGYNDWKEYFWNPGLNAQAFSPFINCTLVSFVSANLTDDDKKFNYSRMLAYSLCCAQFFSNGSVDSVYNAQLYRDLMSHFVRNAVSESAVAGNYTFLYNGVKTPYDWLSSHFFVTIFESAIDPSKSINTDCIFYLRNIFDLHNCLKYGDYFSGAHTRPLAVGDVTAPVVGNQVSAIDMTKAITYQRFLNVVVKLKNEMKDYLSTIFGTLPAPDYHEAKLISHSEGAVDGFEVANTSSEDQGNLTTLLHNVQEKYEFQLEIDQAGVAIGVVSFVASRAYCMVSDRQVHIADRYDMFNPMLQTIGDQSILSIEKNGYGSRPFAYQSRYMEYKQRVNVSSGAFNDKLRSYCIISDSLFEPSNALEVIAQNLTPAYIRLLPREFDRFVKKAGSWSYGNSYHFICEFENQSDDVREADYSPSIL
ncbi:MAG: major capsid protein [Microviridae sp.]|nr:MAG: major capsid protein [Microviridae sp.]